MKILITGGTGLLGRSLCNLLRQAGHEPVVLSRNAVSARTRLASGIEVIQWQPGQERIPLKALDGVGAVINLAGENIGAGRWTAPRKEAILSSRVDTTRALVEAFRGLSIRPEVLISGSAVGYYGPHGDEELTETAPPGTDFLARVCQAWEEEAYKATKLGIRVVTLRTGIVLSHEGGSLPRMVLPFRWYLGGPLGSGKQWLSWVHLDDALEIIRFALEQPTLEGPINVTAPHPVRQMEFASALGQVMKRPSWLRVPAIILKAGLGEMAEMLLTGQRVIPARLIDAGYRFRYSSLLDALKDLLAR
ncbi:TIGR01777 family oxidoreductase [Thermanaeromonas sp. C210]|uniref:TIGR01777 family oxidoreductase n=1 Tax=Thermanaeromonas sp. C210 TaxID=2731925 RepID=UPI00155D4416|nr:TIGR01777 family oxidoreductase [Thermanaeromonas sp. C210]GFN24288.1 epimerase [Thermanaeromonas sp. C210]